MHRNTETILQYLDEGRLLRRSWTTVRDGRRYACLLAAIAPECGERSSSAVCPASVMPQWLARLTPAIDDGGTEANWPMVVRRYADLAGRWHILSQDDWDALLPPILRYVMRDMSPSIIIAEVAYLIERDDCFAAYNQAEWRCLARRILVDAGPTVAERTTVSAIISIFQERETQAYYLGLAVRREFQKSEESADEMIFTILDLIESRIQVRECISAAVVQPQLVDA